MKIIIIIIHIILLSRFELASQNFIYNEGFEELGTGKNWPTGVAQADNLNIWETRTYSTGGLDLHSPDWLNSNGSGNQSINSTFLLPHSGKGMIGMTNYEIIQQDISGKHLPKNTYVTFSAWVYMPSNIASNDCSLRILFSNNKIKYENEPSIGTQEASDLCTEDYITYKNSDGSWKNINEFNFSNLGLSYNTWQKISFAFKTPSSSYDYFGIELRKNGYDPSSIAGNCETSYLFIDDVSLVKGSFCDAVCAPNLGSINYGTLQNAMVANGTPFNLIVQNAIGIEFTLYDSFGHVIAFEDAFDPNGLKDIGYSDYQFLWSGTHPDGSALFPQDVYNYTLRIYNCSQSFTLNNSLTYFTDVCNSCSPIASNIHNFELNECCPNNDLYITNKDYYSTNIEATNGNIYAGDCYFYATANLNCGAVKINPGSNVKYIGKTINLGNGFTVLQGSVFTAIASEDCRYESVFKIAKRERFTSNNSDNKLLENNDVIISPNPSNGIFNVRAIHSTVISIKVFNIYGQEVRSCNNSLASLIDLTDVADELYMYKILLSDGSIVVGRLIKKA